jgi:hypothetical protein
MAVYVYNVGDQAIPQPLALVVGLPPGVRLLNRSGGNSVTAPRSSSRVLSVSNGALNSLEGTTFTLEFRARSPKKIKPSFELVAGL